MKWLIFAGLKLAEISAVALFLLAGYGMEWLMGPVKNVPLAGRILVGCVVLSVFTVALYVIFVEGIPQIIRANIRWSEKIVERLTNNSTNGGKNEH